MPGADLQIVGIGSWQADDLAGWLAVKAVESRWQSQNIHDDNKMKPPSSAGVQPGFHLASSPTDLLDWMREDQTMHVIDACIYEDAVPIKQRLPQRFRVQASEDQIHLVSESPSHLGEHSREPPQLLPCQADPLATDKLPFAREPSAAQIGLAPAFASTSHDLELAQVLELALALHCLPRRTLLWTIPVSTDSPASHRYVADRDWAASCLAFAECGRELEAEILFRLTRNLQASEPSTRGLESADQVHSVDRNAADRNANCPRLSPTTCKHVAYVVAAIGRELALQTAE